jgi:hypothetical protein
VGPDYRDRFECGLLRYKNNLEIKPECRLMEEAFLSQPLKQKIAAQKSRAYLPSRSEEFNRLQHSGFSYHFENRPRFSHAAIVYAKSSSFFAIWLRCLEEFRLNYDRSVASGPGRIY